MAARATILDFRSKDVSCFDLQVTLILPIKFRVICDLHEMSKPIFGRKNKKEYFKMLFAEIITHHAKR